MKKSLVVIHFLMVRIAKVALYKAIECTLQISLKR